MGVKYPEENVIYDSNGPLSYCLLHDVISCLFIHFVFSPPSLGETFDCTKC